AAIDNDSRAPLVDAALPSTVAPADKLERAEEPAAGPISAKKPDNAPRRPAAIPPSEPRAEPVIPLVHAPDDPGPESLGEPENAPQTAPADGRWRIRLFK